MVKIPYNWQPRDYQMPLWSYLENGGKRAAAVWHRRAGKDEVCLHWAAVAMTQRAGSYWHMLPEAAQARKAIWEAINPHTGIRRIDEAFPKEIWDVRRENEMFLKSTRLNSTWQVIGSDNFNSLVGSPPVGIVFSEWSLANSSAWGYMRPILAENGGWALFIYTPRGKNHGYSTYQMAITEPEWFGQRLTVDDTKALPQQMLDNELREYVKEYGEEQGRSFFEQEYMCSFDAAIMGSVYGAWMITAEKEGRIVADARAYDAPIHTAWDLGFDDATAIWFWQLVGKEIRWVDYYETSGEDVKHYCDVLKRYALEKGYKYGDHFVPHDAAYKLLAAGGRSIVQQAWEFGVKMRVVPATSQQNGIEALRKTLVNSYFSLGCGRGLEALKQYQFQWDDSLKMFKNKPRHDWSSHAADAAEIVGQVWQLPLKSETVEKPRFLQNLTAKEVFWPENMENSRKEDRF